MKIISTRARVTAFLLGILTSALVLGGTLAGLTSEDDAVATMAALVMQRQAQTSLN